jgi:predicted nuclease with TOPRIM domain
LDNLAIMPVSSDRSGDGPDGVSLEDLEAFQHQILLHNARLETRVGELEPRTGRLEKLTRDLGTLGDGLKETLAGLVKRSDSQDSRLDMVEPAVESLEGIAVGLTAKSDRLDRQRQGLDDRVRQTEGSISGLDSNVRTLQDLTAALRERQDDTDIEVTALQRTTLLLREQDEVQTEQIEALTDRMDRVEPAHAALQVAHNHLAVHVSDLDQRTHTLRDDFRKGAWVTGGAILFVIAMAASGFWTNAVKQTRLAGQVEQQQATLAETGQQLTQDVAAVDAGVRALDTRVTGDLDVIKQRIYASDEALAGAPVDIATIRSLPWIEAQPAGNYTIQVGSAYTKRALADVIGRNADTLGTDRFAWFRTTRNGRDWFVLLYGSYANFDAALNAQEALPGTLQRSGPYVRTFGGALQSAARG